MKLTTKRVLKALKSPGRYADGSNLYLQVTAPGKGSWLLRYERDGRERMLGLGPINTIGLAEARDRAKRARQQLLDGIDPLEQKRAAKTQRALLAAKSMTFRECAEAYIVANRGAWKNARHGVQWTTTLATYVYPRIGGLPVNVIDTGLVLRCIEPHWQTKTETMSRVRGRIELVLDWATVRSYREGDNPARWRGHLQHVLPARSKVAKPEHHPALPYDQIAEFLGHLRTREGVAARALELTILTAARTGEVIGAKWSEIEGDVWTIPEGRMKGGRQHRVPLCERALEILADVPREENNDYIFIGSRAGVGLSDVAMSNVLRRMKRDDITVHGFRSTFRDWAAERTNYPNHVVEAALAHAVADKVEAAYRRGDLYAKRKQLMNAWAAYCSKPNGDAKVVALRAAR